MDQLFDFIGNHPFLVGIFILLIALFVRNETQRGGRGVSAQQLVDMVNREDAIVVDIREKKEFDNGHIVDAINIPFAALETRIDELKKFRERPVVVMCKMGQHAGSAGTMLRKNGFENVSRLTGGITEWRNQSLPVVKP
ncbi:MAG: rhodanese-like domain-containing protein [Pseudomonadales bacterium]|jgi:rhodanese-related sulfurtransferase|nr:rhodanese-like domain-containing protein [Pseudomonadales bacterium]MDP6472586.1 rhodanese-like domain-containing protein [Pseudomonadales bacterium]MDP6829300.1 rhodanese-like domain-containing protein [Pseudomonadales bacterium]MDP6971840.1 rhodanese-like domain-containing protein [Pseudomonadales bacterium]|tara:strand:- start:653 stop:1069 length:417 start_codon:yes stop_codon:yes gene_type:complete